MRADSRTNDQDTLRTITELEIDVEEIVNADDYDVVMPRRKLEPQPLKCLNHSVERAVPGRPG